MIQTTHHCPHCQGAQLKKNGKTASGKPEISDLQSGLKRLV